MSGQECRLLTNILLFFVIKFYGNKIKNKKYFEKWFRRKVWWIIPRYSTDWKTSSTLSVTTSVANNERRQTFGPTIDRLWSDLSILKSNVFSIYLFCVAKGVFEEKCFRNEFSKQKNMINNEVIDGNAGQRQTRVVSWQRSAPDLCHPCSRYRANVRR